MSRPVESHEAFVGALVTWMHVPRGGFGHTMPVDAKIIALSPHGARATIEVRTKTGGTVHRSVQTANLRWRGAP